MKLLKFIWMIKKRNENSFFEGKLKSNREIISWQSSDGLKIEGVLSRPVEFDSNKNILY